jgi:hypothetical protein
MILSIPSGQFVRYWGSTETSRKNGIAGQLELQAGNVPGRSIQKTVGINGYLLPGPQLISGHRP